MNRLDVGQYLKSINVAAALKAAEKRTVQLNQDTAPTLEHKTINNSVINHSGKVWIT